MTSPITPGVDPWVIQINERIRYQHQFDSLKPVNGVITGVQAKDFFLQSQLPPIVLGQIWGLSDTDSDGKMNINEFSIACKLINLKLRGFEVPCSLPLSLIRSLQTLTGASQGVATSPAGVSQVPAAVSQAPAAVSPIPNVTSVPRPVASPSTIIPKIGPPIVPPMTMPIASQQCKESVAANTRTTIHTPSKPPARPPPYNVGDATAKIESGATPQRPTPPDSIGAGFVSTTGGAPPKPQPPSFPSSPVAVASPVKPVVSPPTVPPIQMVQPLTSSPSNAGMPSVAPVAPIAPLNTAPVPTTAFTIGQAVPMQAMATGIIPPLPTGNTSVSPIVSVATGNGMIGTSVIPQTVTPPVTPIPQNNVALNGSIIHTPVSTNSPLSTTARPPSIDRVGSIDSQHSQHSVSSPQVIEWAVPHQTKLKYTQIFNTSDKTRSGFLSGPQARNIMVQSQLPQAILARIWALSDMDSDGRLGCEEFVLAMHLCDIAKTGEIIPTALPLELIPPTFRRQRQSSVSSQGIPDNVDPLAGMPQTSFEDKRKENFDKGQAELERRRKALLEVQRKEQEERERKEREETEKREKIRLEQERRRQAELEQQMMRQKEIEEEKEEQRKRAQEQREAARKEMERQRQLEWEKQKSQELQAQRQKEQDILLKLKAKNQSLTIELGLLNDKVKELSQKICDTRVGVSSVKTTIDGMRTTRDQQLQEMSTLKNKLRDQNQRLLVCNQEKARIEAKTKSNTAQDNVGQEAQKLAFANKQIALKQMKDKIVDLEEEITEKEKEVENSNNQLEELQNQMTTMLTNYQELNEKFEEKKAKILEMRQNANESGFSNSAWGDEVWGTSDTAEVDVDAWPTDNTVATTATVNEENPSEVKTYRAVYEFVARNQDEISFRPGDIIIVPPVQNEEPGWLAGEIDGHTGWFPESYVKPIDMSSNTSISAHGFTHQDSIEKRMLEEIAEVPENVSDAGSAVGEAPFVEPVTPKLGEGQLCNISATTLYPYRPTIEQHLSFGKGEIVTIKEQQSVWCYGESSVGQVGWFPKSYVKIETINGQNTITPPIDSLNEYYMSLYQYASNEAGDLNFNQGEVILVTKKDGDWWTGVIGSKTGIFPSNYVEKYDIPDQKTTQASLELENEQDQIKDIPETEMKPQEQPEEKTAEQLEEERAEAEDGAEIPDFAAMSAQQRGRKLGIAQVIVSYKATSVEQLDLQKGQLIMIRKKTDSGWWEGELQARGKKRQIGWFPASYVKPFTSSSNRSTPVSHSYQDSPTSDPFVEKVMALYPYKAQHKDEISFEKGDVIVVHSKIEDSWWRGELNGMTGAFPSNYVSPISLGD